MHTKNNYCSLIFEYLFQCIKQHNIHNFNAVLFAYNSTPVNLKKRRYRRITAIRPATALLVQHSGPVNKLRLQCNEKQGSWKNVRG